MSKEPRVSGDFAEAVGVISYVEERARNDMEIP